MRVVRVITRLNVGGPVDPGDDVVRSPDVARIRDACSCTDNSMPAKATCGICCRRRSTCRYLAALRRPLAPAHDARGAGAAARRDARLPAAHRPHAHGQGRHARPAGRGDLQPHRRTRRSRPRRAHVSRPRAGRLFQPGQDAALSRRRTRGSPASPIASSPSRRASRPSCSSSTASAGPTNTASSLSASISPAWRRSTTMPARARAPRSRFRPAPRSSPPSAA